MRFAASVVIASVVFGGSSILAQDDPVLVRVQTRQAKSHVGKLISSDDSETKIFDIGLDAEVSISKRDILRFTSPISDDEAARVIGLPKFFSWQIGLLPIQQAAIGKIAKVSPTAIYFTLGEDKIKVGESLDVFRKKGEIVDPDSGKVIAVERPRVAKIEVTEVAESFSKGKLVGDLETELVIGDEVERAGASERKIAVCPIYMDSGEVTNVGMEISEDLTTMLVKNGTKVVERSALTSVLSELIVQNTILFEPKGAQKLGELTGASHVVVGKIVQNRKLGKVYVRLVDVATGEIRHAASSSVSLVNARVLGKEKGSDSLSGGTTRSRSSSRGAQVKLTENAPRNWLLKKAVRGARIWWDRNYVISTINNEISGGTLIVRSAGDQDNWLPDGAISLERAATMYVVLRTHYLRKPDVNEITISQFERDGWTNMGHAVKSTFPSGEDWRWTVFKKDVPEGLAIVTLESVSLPRKIAMFFIFK